MRPQLIFHAAQCTILKYTIECAILMHYSMYYSKTKFIHSKATKVMKME